MPTYLHVAPVENLPAILRQGLVPAIGEGSTLLNEPVEAIYLICGDWRQDPGYRIPWKYRRGICAEGFQSR